jgi:hypothetical protein
MLIWSDASETSRKPVVRQAAANSPGRVMGRV